MAAAASSRSKGGLFLILTVLCLVGLASSCKDLDDLKARIQKTEDNLYQLKAKKDVSSTSTRHDGQMMAAAEKLRSEESDNDKLPMTKLIQSLLHSFDTAMGLLGMKGGVFDAEITNIKLELEKIKQLVQAHEEYHSEL